MMTTDEHHILVIGAAGLDVKVWPRTPVVEPGRSNPGIIRWNAGGVARNTAENLARLGAEVQLITAVGDDEPGQQLLAGLRAVGVDTSIALTLPGEHTGAYVALHQTDGQLRLAFDDMHLTRAITPGYLYQHRRRIKEADLICIDANLTAPTLRTLFRLAAQYHIPVCADPTAALLAPRLHPYLNQLALTTPSREQAEALLGTPLSDDAALSQGARRLVQMGVQLVVITLGARGLYYATSEESGRLPAFQVEVVDPSGAGDALTAAIALALLEELPAAEAVRLGLAAAALTLSCTGAVCPTLTFDNLYDWLIV